MASLTKEERLALINENLEEALNMEIIEEVLAQGRDPKIYWGMFWLMGMAGRATRAPAGAETNTRSTTRRRLQEAQRPDDRTSATSCPPSR